MRDSPFPAQKTFQSSRSDGSRRLPFHISRHISNLFQTARSDGSPRDQMNSPAANCGSCFNPRAATDRRATSHGRSCVPRLPTFQSARSDGSPRDLQYCDSPNGLDMFQSARSDGSPRDGANAISSLMMKPKFQSARSDGSPRDLKVAIPTIKVIRFQSARSDGSPRDHTMHKPPIQQWMFQSARSDGSPRDGRKADR